jgi:hypothetical protein
VPYSRLAYFSQVMGGFAWPTAPFCIGVPLAIAAIVTSVMARNRLHPEDRVGAYMATLGMYSGCWTFGIVGCVIVGAVAVVALGSLANPLLIGLLLFIVEGAVVITLIFVTYPRPGFPWPPGRRLPGPPVAPPSARAGGGAGGGP